MRDGWTPKPADRVVRHPRQEEIGPVRVTVTARKVPSRFLASPLIILYAFAGIIAVGTLLLLMPVAHTETGITPFMTALFTATSAVTVTGLVVEETATYWSRIGQVIILGLMFVGGLGFMTFATFLLILIGQRVTLAQRLLVRESLGINQLGGLVRLTVGIVVMSVAIQLVGFIALLARFLFVYTPAEAIWQAAFHTVSGFNNAGFVALTEPGGLSSPVHNTDEFIIAIIAVLIVLGSVSYWVLTDMIRYRRFRLFTLNTKLVLVFTVALIVVGALGFLVSEYDNADTIGRRSVPEKLTTSVFESISGRTAGFSTVDFGETRQRTNFFFTSLMFIGGASASVAGGIKVNTLAVVLVAVFSTIKGRNHATAFGREIPQVQVQRAMVIGALSTAFVFLMALLLIFSEESFRFIDLFFETVSAFGTVGLSTGHTGEFSRLGHLIIVITMFLGRLGPLTVGLTIAQREGIDMFRYARERVTIG